VAVDQVKGNKGTAVAAFAASAVAFVVVALGSEGSPLDKNLEARGIDPEPCLDNMHEEQPYRVGKQQQAWACYLTKSWSLNWSCYY
jgi:hypothetical protein